jgi:peptide-methionine (S)-S-oxide reductase
MIRSFLVGLVVMVAVMAVLTMLAPSTTTAAVAIPSPAVDDTIATAKGQQTVVLAGGCFWGIQAVFEHVKGVKSVTAGYSGGAVKNPSYEQVSSGATGHAESVKIVYDPSKVTFGQLLKVFFSVAHDPTELDRQGPDNGTQYRSAVFFTSDSQQHIAKAYIDQLNSAKVYGVFSVLPGRGLSPGLRREESVQHVHHDERRAESREPEEGFAGFVQGALKFPPRSTRGARMHEFCRTPRVPQFSRTD